MDIQAILDAIKDYGAAIISSISVGGVAALVAVVIKVKQGIDKTKEAMNSVLKKKDETEAELNKRYSELDSTIKVQNEKLDALREDITKIKRK